MDYRRALRMGHDDELVAPGLEPVHGFLKACQDSAALTVVRYEAVAITENQRHLLQGGRETYLLTTGMGMSANTQAIRSSNYSDADARRNRRAAGRPRERSPGSVGPLRKNVGALADVSMG